MPLLGHRQRPAILHSHRSATRRTARRTLGPALSKAVTELDSDLPTYFPGTPAQLHDESLSGNRIVVSLFAIFGACRLRSLRGWSLRRDEFFREPANPGIWNSNGAWRGCPADFPNGHDTGRVATGDRACARRGRGRFAAWASWLRLRCETFSSR